MEAIKDETSAKPFMPWNKKHKYAGITGITAAAAFVARVAIDKSGSIYPYQVIASADLSCPALVFGNTQEQADANAEMITNAVNKYEQAKAIISHFQNFLNATEKDTEKLRMLIDSHLKNCD